jgi:hypothetical protein
MAGIENYVYQPLSPHADDEIRLLHLSPGTGDDAIQFTLQPTRLSLTPSYEAISYRWGDPTDTRPALCDGKTMTINASLHAALRRLRLADATRVLWADAACIGQANVAEKSHQVNTMGRIYTQPTRVLIWLGEGGPELHGLGECIRTALELLPPEVYEWEELYETSKRVFQEALVRSHFHSPGATKVVGRRRGTLAEPSIPLRSWINSNSSERANPTSSTMTGVP